MNVDPKKVLNELNKDPATVANAKKYKDMIEQTENDQSGLLDELAETPPDEQSDVAADVQRILSRRR